MRAPACHSIPPSRGSRRARSVRTVLALAGSLLLGGCAVPMAEQRLVSKPNMEFSRWAVYSYSSRLITQVQPGLATEAGSQASTCTLCR